MVNATAPSIADIIPNHYGPPATIIPIPNSTSPPIITPLGPLILARPDRNSLPPGLIPQPLVMETYRAGKHGADSVVTFSGRDAEIMNKMAQVSDILQAMAMELNQFTGVMSTTRALIRSCRNLSTELQEEIEIRKGPQG